MPVTYALGLLFCSSYSHAKQKSADFILFTGASVSQIETSFDDPSDAAFEDEEAGSEDNQKQKVALGGFPLGVDFPAHQSESIEGYYGGSLLLDIPNSQVSKTEFHGGILWNIMGGPSLLANNYQDQNRAQLTRSWDSQTSLLLQAGLNQYSASTEDLSVKISGSTFEIKTGFRNRSVTLGYDYMFQFAVSILSLPADMDRVSSQSLELLMLFPI